MVLEIILLILKQMLALVVEVEQLLKEIMQQLIQQVRDVQVDKDMVHVAVQQEEVAEEELEVMVLVHTLELLEMEEMDKHLLLLDQQ